MFLLLLDYIIFLEQNYHEKSIFYAEMVVLRRKHIAGEVLWF